VLPHDFLEAALDLTNSSKGKPKQAHLRRAVSTTYYAMFHTLARCCADLFIGGTGSSRSKEAWQQVYRALDHGFANKRHDADYNPDGTVFKSAVLTDISTVEAAIDGFSQAPLKDRRAFAAFVMLKQRN
jgi:hypothetical protein